MEDKVSTLLQLTSFSRYAFNTPTQPTDRGFFAAPHYEPKNVRFAEIPRWDWIPENPQNHAIRPFNWFEESRARYFGSNENSGVYKSFVPVTTPKQAPPVFNYPIRLSNF